VRISILPKTSLGRWSVALVAAFFLLFVLEQTFVASVLRGLRPNPVSPPVSPPPMVHVVATISGILFVAAPISGISAFVTGLISVLKSKERSILVFLAVFIGLFVLIFCLGEVLVPH